MIDGSFHFSVVEFFGYVQSQNRANIFKFLGKSVDTLNVSSFLRVLFFNNFL